MLKFEKNGKVMVEMDDEGKLKILDEGLLEAMKPPGAGPIKQEVEEENKEDKE